MPKESTHLYLSQLAERDFQEKNTFTKIQKILNLYPGLFYLGSVLPDTIFNYIKGPCKAFFKKHIKYSHDSEGHNIFKFLELIAKKNLPFEAGLSLSLGVISHLSADAIFHPLIFYFTGNEKTDKQKSTIRHYYFESNLDKTLRWLNPWLKHLHLLDMDLFSEEEQFVITTTLEALHIPPEEQGLAPSEEFISMAKQHIKHEGYYGRLSYWFISTLLNIFTGGKKQELKALFYLDKNSYFTEELYQKIMNEKINYKNPESGEAFTKSLNNLIQDYLDLFFENILPIEKELCKMPENKKAEWKNLSHVFKEIIPRSPTTGLISYPKENGFNKMSFFELKTFGEVFKNV